QSARLGQDRTCGGPEPRKSCREVPRRIPSTAPQDPDSGGNARCTGHDNPARRRVSHRPCDRTSRHQAESGEGGHDPHGSRFPQSQPMGRVAVSEMIRERLARYGRDSSTPSLVLVVLKSEQSSGERVARAAREETFSPRCFPVIALRTISFVLLPDIIRSLLLLDEWAIYPGRPISPRANRPLEPSIVSVEADGRSRD